MFQHFGNRLKRDLKQLVDRRLDINALSSGSSIKASSSPKRETDWSQLYSYSHLALKLRLYLTNVNGMPPNASILHHLTSHRYAVWFGGSLLASLVGGLQSVSRRED